MALMRSAGSMMSEASDTDIALTWLPTWSLELSVRVDTGTWAMSDFSGSSPRSSRYLRMALETSASTTSFSFTPNASLTALTRSRGTPELLTRRCGEIGPLNRVGGASK